MNFIAWLLGVPLAIVIGYLAVRVWTKAHYKSKQEYMEWFNKRKD